MLSEKKLAANRINSQLSTGPRTPDGKAASSQNALRHGLLARNLILPQESQAEFQEFARSLAARLAPDGSLESLLAERIIAAAWRLRRALRIERDILAIFGCRDSKDPAAPLQYGGDAYAVLKECGSAEQPLDKIGRYEARLHRAFARDLAQLRQLQRSRPSTPQPLTIDASPQSLAIEASPQPQASIEAIPAPDEPTSSPNEPIAATP